MSRSEYRIAASKTTGSLLQGVKGETTLKTSTANTLYTEAHRHTTSCPLLEDVATTKRAIDTAASITGGYLLSHDYWEQLTSATRSLFSLQCWASRLNMSVPEPYLKSTSLYSPTKDKDLGEDWMHFGDVYDIEYWNELSRRTNYSSLVPWDHFLMRAPRNLITVEIKYGGRGERESVG